MINLQHVHSYFKYLSEGQDQEPFADVENGPSPRDCEFRPATPKELWKAAHRQTRLVDQGIFTGVHPNEEIPF